MTSGFLNLLCVSTLTYDYGLGHWTFSTFLQRISTQLLSGCYSLIIMMAALLFYALRFSASLIETFSGKASPYCPARVYTFSNPIFLSQFRIISLSSSFPAFIFALNLIILILNS